MGGEEQTYQEKALKENDGNDATQDQWMIMGSGNGICDFESNDSSFEDSDNSIGSSSSSSDMEEATSSTSSSSPSSYGPLYELSELMAQLPIKRGLSKYYQGKSQTFTSLANVKSLEDLSKRGRPQRRKIKSSKSYGGGLDSHIFSPKATISKKSSLARRGALYLSSFRPSTNDIIKKNFKCF